MEGTDGVLCFVLLQNCNRSGMQFISNSYVHDLHMFYCLSCILFFWNTDKPVHSFLNILQTTTRYYSSYFEQLWIRKRLYSLMNLKGVFSVQKAILYIKGNKTVSWKFELNIFRWVWHKRNTLPFHGFGFPFTTEKVFAKDKCNAIISKNEKTTLSKVKGVI